MTVSIQDLKIAAFKVMRQGRGSLSPRSKHCRYRGAQDTCCAIGFLIPDRAYHKGLEGKGAWTRAVAAAIGGYENDGVGHFAGQLQRAHDEAAVGHPAEFFEQFKAELLARGLITAWSYSTTRGFDAAYARWLRENPA